MLLLVLMPSPMVSLQYMLGFVDDPEKPTDLLRHRFPSKVGGVPVSSALYMLAAMFAPGMYVTMHTLLKMND